MQWVERHPVGSDGSVGQQVGSLPPCLAGAIAMALVTVCGMPAASAGPEKCGSCCPGATGGRLIMARAKTPLESQEASSTTLCAETSAVNAVRDPLPWCGALLQVR
jgi:hypothetical protein